MSIPRTPWLIRWALMAFPPAFREAHGAEMEEDYAEAASKCPMGLARVRLSVATAADLIVSGLRERRAARGTGRERERADVRSRDRAFAVLDYTLRDLRHAGRALARRPGFSLLALATLALGIGGNTAIFSVVNTVLLKPLEYGNPDRLVTLGSSHPDRGQFFPLSYPDFRDLRAESGTLADIAFTLGETVLLRGDDLTERVLTAYVSDDFFSLLGTSPLHGRTFLAEEEQGASGAPVAVLSHRFWQRRFGGDPGIIGQTLDFADFPLTIIGVMPAGFAFPSWAEVWTPLAPVAGRLPTLEQRDYRVDQAVIGRLKADVTLAEANAELEGISARLAEAYPAENERWSAGARSLREEVVGDARRSLLILLAAVGGVLLVACVNVANLALVQATTRRREIVVRTALGASRWRVARQFLMESVILGVVGGLIGLLLAYWGVGALRGAAPANLPRLDELAVDGTVIAVTTALALGTAVIFAIAPSLHAVSSPLAEAIREGSAGRGGPKGGRLRSWFVSSQLALALVLFIGAGLLIRSFAEVRSVDVGFDTERLVTFRVEPPEARYESPESLLQLYDRLHASVRELPAVRSVGIASHIPLSPRGVGTPFEVDGVPPDAARQPAAAFRLVDEHYFSVLGQQIVQGRGFARPDMTSGSTAVIINETLAREYWSGVDPVGRRITAFKQMGGREDYGERIEGTVVGVVSDVRTFGPESEVPPETYLPLPVNAWWSAYLVIRTTGDPAAVVPSVRRAVLDIERDIPVAGTFSIRTGDELLGSWLSQRRFTTMLLTLFAGTALLLAAIGVYGVMAYAVTQRTAEIGIRSALGADRGAVLRLFLLRGLLLALAGVAVGLIGALAVTRVLSGLLFEVQPADPLTFVGATVVLVAVAFLATYLPARRATTVDPVRALKAE